MIKLKRRYNTLSGILTVKTKVSCESHIEQAAKERGHKVEKIKDTLKVHVNEGYYGSVTFKKNTNGTFDAKGDTMNKQHVNRFLQACNVVAVRELFMERGYKNIQEPGLRNLEKNSKYVIQANV